MGQPWFVPLGISGVQLGAQWGPPGQEQHTQSNGQQVPPFLHDWFHSPFTAAMARNITPQKTIAFLFTEHRPMHSKFTGCKGQGLQHTSTISQIAALKKA